MAVSGSTDFKSSASTLIIGARRLLGIMAEEQPLSATDLNIGLDMLTRMLKTWEADPDLGTWLETDLPITLIQGTVSYLFGVGGTTTTIPFDINSILITRNGVDLPMDSMSRQDYKDLPLKTTQGFPTQWFYDRQRDNGTLYVWPAPDVTAGVLTVTYRRRIMDVDTTADNLDIPPEWEEAVINNLAKRLIPTSGRGGTPEAAQVMVDAKLMLDALKAFDATNDNGSISILPEQRRYRRNWNWR